MEDIPYYLVTFLLLCSCLILKCGALDSLRCREAVRVSTDRTLLPLLSITALRPGTFSPLFRIVARNDDEQWCANTDNSGPAVNNHINMSFTEPVLVEAIVSRGHAVGEQPVFISSFNLLYSVGETAPLQQYSKHFFPNSRFTEHFVFRDLIAAVKLQFLINGAVISAGHYYCWHLDIIGCALRDAIPVPVASTCPVCPDTPGITIPTEQPTTATCPPCEQPVPPTCPVATCPNSTVVTNPTEPPTNQVCPPCELPPAPTCPYTITLYRYLVDTYTEIRTVTAQRTCSTILTTPIAQGVTTNTNQITLGVGTAMLAAGVIIITGSIVIVLFGIIVWSRRKSTNRGGRRVSLQIRRSPTGTADGSQDIVWRPAVVEAAPEATQDSQQQQRERDTRNETPT